MQTEKAAQIFLTSRKAKGLSPQTIRWYKGILDLYAKQFTKLPMKPEHIEQFLMKCQAGDERRHGYYRTIRALYRFLHRRMNLKDPIERIDPPRRKPKYPKVLTPDELDQLLAYPHKHKIKTALLFLIDTGSRVGELTNLQVRDLSETPYGYIARISGKTGVRLVPVSNETYRALMKNLPFGYSTYRLRRLVSRAFRDAHVSGSAIKLRHTFGTIWEGDELVLQKIMGHAHLSTTMNYRHLRTRVLSTQHREYSPLKMVFAHSKSML